MSNASSLTITSSPIGRNGSATLTATLGDVVLALDRVDLAKNKSRDSFIDLVCKDRPGIDREAVEKKLLQMAAERTATAKEKPSVGDDVDDSARLLEKMPELVREDARRTLEAPNLMKRIVDDISALGVAGEKSLTATIYLVGTSRLLPNPLATIVIGPTASGKSYSIEKTAILIPPEATLMATQQTPQALFYMPPGSLSHRFVVAG